MESYTTYMYYVYILKNVEGVKYIGVTTDLKVRLSQHNSNQTRTTKNKGEYKVVWYCAFCDKEKAYNFEKYLKSSSGYAFTSKHLI